MSIFYPYNYFRGRGQSRKKKLQCNINGTTVHKNLFNYLFFINFKNLQYSQTIFNKDAHPTKMFKSIEFLLVFSVLTSTNTKSSTLVCAQFSF